MEEKQGIKISLQTFFLILAIIVIIIMGYFIYKLYNDKETTIVNNETSTDLYIIKEINISSQQSLYNFKTKKWVNQISGAEGFYFLAIDSEKNLYIVDRYENVLKKLDAKLEKLNLDDTNIDNYVTYANVSKEDNSLIISTGDDFITFIVNLEDFSTKLSEVNDE